MWNLGELELVEWNLYLLDFMWNRAGPELLRVEPLCVTLENLNF